MLLHIQKSGTTDRLLVWLQRNGEKNCVPVSFLFFFFFFILTMMNTGQHTWSVMTIKCQTCLLACLLFLLLLLLKPAIHKVRSGIRVSAPGFSFSVSSGRYMYESQRSDMNLKKAFHPYLESYHHMSSIFHWKRRMWIYRCQFPHITSDHARGTGWLACRYR